MMHMIEVKKTVMAFGLLFFAISSPTLSVAVEPPPQGATATSQAPEASQKGASTSPQSTNPDFHEAEFSQTIGQRIYEGFLFFDGQYLDAPYVVKRVGLAIIVNDTIIEPPARWPLPEPDPRFGKLNPALPASMNKDTPESDIALGEYLGYKLAFIKQNSAADEVPTKMTAVIRNLPNVIRAEYDPAYAHAIRVQWSDGTESSVGISQPCESRALRTKEEWLASYEHMRKSREDGLRHGGVFLLSSEGGEIAMGSARVLDTFPRMVEILRSRKTEEEKLDALRELGIGTVPSPSVQKLVTHFRASPQLEQRIADAIRLHQNDQEGPTTETE